MQPSIEQLGSPKERPLNQRLCMCECTCLFNVQGREQVQALADISHSVL